MNRPPVKDTNESAIEDLSQVRTDSILNMPPEKKLFPMTRRAALNVLTHNENCTAVRRNIWLQKPFSWNSE